MQGLRELESLQQRPVSSADEQPPAKRARPGSGKAALEAAELLARAERELEESQVEVAAVDENGMKAMVLAVERRINDNMALRMKYPDRPEKFMDSELELFSHLKRLHVLATAPELFPTFVRTKCVSSLLGLLMHENSDISIDVVDLLHEMADADGADPDDVKALADALVEHGAPAALMEHLKRLDEAVDEESRAVHQSLGIFEALLEASPELSAPLARDAGLMSWLLGRIKLRPFHANKLYATELLAVLLQQNAPNQALFGEEGGVLALLTATSYYKRREPQALEEAELVENMYDCLCSALHAPANQTLFLKAEGIELMILTLKERRFAAQLAHDEHCASLLVTLLHQLTGERRRRHNATSPPASIARAGLTAVAERPSTIPPEYRIPCGLLGKLAEGDCEKLERLLRLHFSYTERVELAAEAALAVSEVGRGGEEDEDELDDALYLARTGAGLRTLQLVDTALCYVAGSRAKPLLGRLLHGLYEGGASLHSVWGNADEHLKTCDGGDEPLPDAAEQRSVSEMGEAVRALLSRYKSADDAEGEGGDDRGEGSADAAASSAGPE
ncbi:hypothetical protein EMIHUDRAFT_448624 [Emiliania huxleyi CCMP1516]|uniref:Beta-catenin-like protein 1 N-terminal domain-containing protein n=2 Tax=Emiliania huxleyi TaxID=2903 RepID=A0A0D3I270_EMIH1|nr:hypothetical protein EMIHUDRAFT_448624 [Emiliania huxleyi CCMP1516]EOD05355.1 hypothetical protein EMIHUDRAFT_448624 [Emiliania huxleyi CCMP1516]|eukprot:XP_005757784.1 hypothetical protein EMIHUDRAFT_448624 [Emiliania huxleyi CCMP1516]